MPPTGVLPDGAQVVSAPDAPPDPTKPCSVPGFHNIRSISVLIVLGGRQSLFLAPFPFGGKGKPAGGYSLVILASRGTSKAEQNAELSGLLGTTGEESASRKGENERAQSGLAAEENECPRGGGSWSDD